MVFKILLDILLLLLAMVLISFPVGVILACRSVTNSNNFYKFLIDKQYWAFSLVNSNYRKSVEQGIPYCKFKKDFWNKFEMPFTKPEKALLRLSDESRATIIFLLCNPSFVQENLNVPRFDYKTFLDVSAKWKDYLKSLEHTGLSN